MKKSTVRKLIQKPLRFHHQDIHDEIEGLTDILISISNRLVTIERLLGYEGEKIQPRKPESSTLNIEAGAFCGD